MEFSLENMYVEEIFIIMVIELCIPYVFFSP